MNEQKQEFADEKTEVEMKKPGYMTESAWNTVKSVLNLENTGELDIIHDQVLLNHGTDITAEDCIEANKEMSEGRQMVIKFIEGGT